MDVGDGFADWLKGLRAAMGWSQKTAAQKCGVSPGYIGLIETSERIPPVHRVEEMVRHLVEAGVPVKVHEVVDIRNEARLERAHTALEALGTGTVAADDVTRFLAETDKEDDAPAVKRKVGRPSRAQRLREQLAERCEGLDEPQLRQLIGYADRLVEERAAAATK